MVTETMHTLFRSLACISLIVIVVAASNHAQEADGTSVATMDGMSVCCCMA
jgi:hypothetical protein